jgi:hypothetical protein
MVEWEQGEYIDNNIVKKKIILTKNDKEIDFQQTIDDITKRFTEYTKHRFEEIDGTLLPLARYVAANKSDIMGILLGFAIGSEFERQGIRIRTEEVELSEEESAKYNSWKLGAYDFFVEEVLKSLKKDDKRHR